MGSPDDAGFEDHLTALERIVADLESGNLTLDELWRLADSPEWDAASGA